MQNLVLPTVHFHIHILSLSRSLVLSIHLFCLRRTLKSLAMFLRCYASLASSRMFYMYITYNKTLKDVKSVKMNMVWDISELVPPVICCSITLNPKTKWLKQYCL